MLTCPFCGAPETDRISVDGRRFLVFQCLFTPEVDPSLPDEAIASKLRTDFTGGGSAYFRGMCDRLHLYVTKGKGAEELTAPSSERRPVESP